VDPDGGGGGDATDGGGKGPAIVYSVRANAGTASTTSGAFGDIPDLAHKTIVADGKDRYLFILSVPMLWSSASDNGAALRIADGDTTLASGTFTGPNLGVIPMTLFAAKQLPAGAHTIRAQWRAYPGQKAVNLGPRAARLVIVRTAADDLQFRSEVFAGVQTLTSNAVWSDIGEITVKQAGDYLLVLNIPSGWATTTGECAQYRIVDASDTMLAGGNTCYAAFANQRVPFTTVGVAQLAAGDTIRSQWAHNGSGGVCLDKSDGAEDATWLVALRVPRGITSGKGKSEVKTTSQSYVEIQGGVQPIRVTPATGGDHLFILSAPEASANKPGVVNLQLLLDGTPLADAGASFSTSSQHISVTLVGVKSLTAGKEHVVRARWNTAYNAEGTLGHTYPHWLLGFTYP
jgi:hypothetical protein